MLSKQEIDYLLSRLAEPGADTDAIIQQVRDDLKKDVADLAVLQQPLAAGELPATDRLNNLRAQQDVTLSSDAQTVLLNIEYVTALETLAEARKFYADRTATLIVEAIDNHITDITAKQQALKINETSAVNTEITNSTNAKSRAKRMGTELARACISNSTGNHRLEKVAEVDKQLTLAANDPDANSKKAAVKKALIQLHENSYDESAALRQQKEIAGIIQQLKFDPQVNSTFRGEPAIPAQLNELANIIHHLHQKQHELINLMTAVEPSTQEQITIKKRDVKKTALELNNWLLAHEKGGFLQTIENKADLLKQNEALMLAVGYQQQPWYRFTVEGDRVRFPSQKSGQTEASYMRLPGSYTEVAAGTYGGIIKLYTFGTSLHFATPEVRETTEIDMSDVILPIRGGKPPMDPKYSLLQVLLDLYGSANSDKFKKHVILHENGDITLQWNKTAEAKELLNAIKQRNKDYLEHKNDIEIKAKPEQISATVKREALPSVFATVPREIKTRTPPSVPPTAAPPTPTA